MKKTIFTKGIVSIAVAFAMIVALTVNTNEVHAIPIPTLDTTNIIDQDPPPPPSDLSTWDKIKIILGLMNVI